MNITCMVIGIVFLLFVLVGWRQGMFQLVISVAGLIASVMVSLYGAPYVSGYLQENTKLDDNIASYIVEQLEFSETGQEVTKGIQVAVINSLPLPETLRETILDNNNSEMYEALSVSGVYDYIAMSLAVVILNAVVFLVLLLTCRIFFFVLGRSFKDLSTLPIVNSVDRIGGGLLGGMKGLIWIWVFFLFLSMTSTFEWSAGMISEIHQYKLVTWLYDNNLLLDIVGDLTKVLFH